MATRYPNSEELPLTDADRQFFDAQAPDYLKGGEIIKKIRCTSCGAKYIVHTDGIHMPAKYSGQDNCACGVVLIEYNTTEEPFLFTVPE